MNEVTFRLACRNGHSVDGLSPEDAERLNLSACNVCFKPLFVEEVVANVSSEPEPVE